ncbi:MAG: hypothetical protein ACTSRP_07965 [Candidatus Helarchaeota archaeon]
MDDDDSILLREFKNLLKNFNNAQKSLKRFTEVFENQLGLSKKKDIGKAIGITNILELPEDLRKSALAVVRLRKNATLDKIANLTKRDKNLEKGFLEALVAMNILTKDTSGDQPIYSPSLGKKRPIISDDVWALLIKDSAEMVKFICNLEIEKAEMKILDIDEMIQLAPQLSDIFVEIKDKIYNYITDLKAISSKIPESEKNE